MSSYNRKNPQKSRLSDSCRDAQSEPRLAISRINPPLLGWVRAPLARTLPQFIRNRFYHPLLSRRNHPIGESNSVTLSKHWSGKIAVELPE